MHLQRDDVWGDEPVVVWHCWSLLVVPAPIVPAYLVAAAKISALIALWTAATASARSATAETAGSWTSTLGRADCDFDWLHLWYASRTFIPTGLPATRTYRYMASDLCD